MPESGGEVVGKAAGALGAGRAAAGEGMQARDLPNALAEIAEQGKGVLVNQILMGMSSGQRIDVLRQMDIINEMHRKTNQKLPDLVIDYDKKGYSVAVDYPGTKDDMVIVTAKVNKYDEVTTVTCNTAKELPITRGHGKLEPKPEGDKVEPPAQSQAEEGPKPQNKVT